MLGHSHALSGGVTGLATGLFLQFSFPQTVALAGFTAGMALLPDLDKCGSSPARCLGFLSEAVAWIIGRLTGGHRHRRIPSWVSPASRRWPGTPASTGTTGSARPGSRC